MSAKLSWWKEHEDEWGVYYTNERWMVAGVPHSLVKHIKNHHD